MEANAGLHTAPAGAVHNPTEAVRESLNIKSLNRPWDRGKSNMFNANKEWLPLWTHVANFGQRNAAAKLWASIRRHANAERLMSGEGFAALVQRIEVDCDTFETKNVFFLFDEAQALDTAHLDMLKFLSEHLIALGYNPFTLLMAQPQVLRLRESLISRDRMDLVMRFFKNMHRFRGLQEADLRTLLDCYDTLKWPAGKGGPYTAYFAPDLWRDGFRLSHVSRDLWAAFVRFHAALQLETNALEVGSEYVVRSCLRLLMLCGKSGKRPSGELFDQAVAQSGLAEALTVNQLARSLSGKGTRAREKQ